MDKKIQLKPIAAALGTTFAITLAASPLVNASDNPFSTTEFTSDYIVADVDRSEGSCGQGRWAKSKAKTKEKEDKCGERKADDGKAGEGECGEGKAKDGKV